MRLALQIYGSLDQLSGGYLYDRLVVEQLRRRGHQVQVISLEDRGYLRNLLNGFTARTPSTWGDAGPDLVLQDELCHPSLSVANRRLRRRGFAAPIVTLLHHPRSAEAGSPWRRRLTQALEKAYLQTVDGVVCTSHVTDTSLDSLDPPAVARVVAHPGRDHLRGSVDVAQIRRRAQQPGPLQILFLGNLIPRKGLDTLLTALAQLPQETWRLTVVGSQQMAPGFVRGIGRQARRLRLNGRFRQLGPLPHAALEQLLPEMHVSAIPSRHEGFGIAYLDGMGYGLPALASASGGARDIVREGENGFLIQPGDAAALAGRLSLLINDRSRLAQMGVAARNTWQAHPGWEQTAAVIEVFLKEQLGRTRKRSPAPQP